MKQVKKLLAMILTLATLIGIFSSATTVFAEEYNNYSDNKAYQETLLTEAVENGNEKAEIICEVAEKRDEYTKTYKRADGSFTTVLSKTPIHKLQNGEWVEIDNSLKSESTVIVNKNGAFDIEFPETISQNEEITISNGDDSISFSVNEIESAEAVVNKTKVGSDNIVEKDLSKTMSEITYENVNNNTDLQYIVSSNSVKENIIVSNKESLKDTYTFNIEKGNLSVEIDKENNIVFKNDKNEIAFKIPAPVMTDAENAVSYDIDVEVKNANKSVIELVYTPSKTWLESEERVYPIVIDPVIEFPSSSGKIMEDALIGYSSDNPDAINENECDSPFGFIFNKTLTNSDNTTTRVISEALIKINMDAFSGLKQPDIAITDVNFIADGNVADGNFIVKAIDGDWDCKTITYADVHPANDNEPVISYDDEIVDYHTGYSSAETDDNAGAIAFNITELFNQWLAGERNNDGFAVVAEENVSGVLYLDGFVQQINSNNKTYFDTYISIDYVDTSGANDSFEYLTQEIGRAGTANVNTFSRSLSLHRSDLGLDGLRMPVNLGFIYSPAIDSFYEYFVKLASAIEGVEIVYPELCGNNWWPSYCFYLLITENNQIQVFTNEGTLVTFNVVEESVTETDPVTSVETTKTVKTFEADEGSDVGYELELIDPDGYVRESNIKLILPSGEHVYFNNDGSISIREDTANSDGSFDEITVYYLSEELPLIGYITDGIGRIYAFDYDPETYLLKEIKCFNADETPIKAGTTDIDLKVTYGYDSNRNLTSVTYPDGETVTYSYDSNGNLVKVQNIDGYNIQYTYDSLGKVTNIAEYAGTTPGNSITLNQLSDNQVKVSDDFSGTQTYQFGKDGKLHYTFDEKGNYYKSDYAPANDENVFSSNDWKITSQNLLKNGSFEEVRSAKALDWSNSFNVEDIEPSEALTDYACRVSAVETTNELQSQTVSVDGGGSYTFSLYAKSNLSSLSDSDRLYMRITAEDEDGNETTESRQLTLTENFEQYSITVSKSGITSVTVEFGLKNKTGDFYINNAQLEKGDGTAPFNYIKNGSFNNADDKWTTATIVDETLNSEPVKAVKLNGGLPQYTVGYGLDRTAEQESVGYGLDRTAESEEITPEDHISSTTQNVKINGKKGDTFSVGGWFKGDFDDNSIYNEPEKQYQTLETLLANSLAQIKVTYTYFDEAQQSITENFVVDFDAHNHDWQYAVDTFALKGDTESVDVTILAKNIPADCYVTGISLEQDFDSEVITDDDIETEDSGEEDESICSCGCEECYFGENCPCSGAINNDCQCPECLRNETSTEDSFGNTLSNKSTDGINYIETFDSYTQDGNNLASTTDENGNVVTYDYDVLNGILKSVSSPMGTGNETTTTNYSYDAMGKVVSVSTTVSDTENQALQYVYSKDRLTEIITPNVKYRILYDNWGQVTSVNIVTDSEGTENVIPLVEYTYNEGKNRTQVKTAIYKNSSTNRCAYRYDYYDDGTLEYVYLNEEQIHFVEYDNLGVLTSIQNTGGRTVEYTDKGTFIYNPDNVCIYSTVTNEDGTVTEENYGVSYKTFAPESNYDSATGISTETEKIEINSNNRITKKTETDYFGRTKSQNISVYNITNETEETPATLIGKINTEYDYSVAEDSKTSSTVEKLINKTYNGDSETYRVYSGYFYEYDKQNKISAEKTLNADGTTTDKYSYEYDKLGQLVRFNDAVANKTYTYAYDNNGNILTKSEYAYTLNEELGTATNTTSYDYENQWKDRLSTVGNKSITYDNIGNPTNYLGATLTWEGRQLKSYENDEKIITYEYDENGMRYRTVAVDKNTEENSTAIIDYVWLGEKLVSMVLTDGDSTSLAAKYLYNSSDQIIGFKWVNGVNEQSTYYYLKNLQGDITGIVNSSGKLEISFSYDVWGNVTTDLHVDSSSPLAALELINKIYIGLLNPFGYRGYCLDGYTNLYYLQSRYYDPNTGRFINADDTNYLNATGTVLGCNLFAYCENDGVNFVDENGYAKKSISGNAYNNRYSGSYKGTKPSYTLTFYIGGEKVVAFYENGIIKVRNWRTDIKKIFETGKTKTFAYALRRLARKINENALKGRTVDGIAYELIAHYVWYQKGVVTSSSAVTDCGAKSGKVGFDYNAYIFEKDTSKFSKVEEAVKKGKLNSAFNKLAPTLAKLGWQKITT